jgi:hypothetical protein
MTRAVDTLTARPDVTDPAARLQAALAATNLYVAEVFHQAPYALPTEPGPTANNANVQLAARMLIDDLWNLVEACGWDPKALMRAALDVVGKAGHGPGCERCGTVPDDPDDLDPDSGLCDGCRAYNESRVTL